MSISYDMQSTKNQRTEFSLLQETNDAIEYLLEQLMLDRVFPVT
jgi:hypothetical protein